MYLDFSLISILQVAEKIMAVSRSGLNIAYVYHLQLFGKLADFSDRQP
jgi:hypothetical protein